MRKTGVPNERFPALLKEKRETRRMSAGDLAARVGVSEDKIALWEAGADRPRRDKWARLANALGLTVEELILGRAPHAAAPHAAAPRADLAAQVGRLVAAFVVCEESDRQVLLRNAEWRARGRSVPH